MLGSTPIDYGHDWTLLELDLALSPTERVQRQAEWARSMRSIRVPPDAEDFDPLPLLAALARAGSTSSSSSEWREVRLEI